MHLSFRSSLVYDFLQNYFNSNHSLIIDNYYTSIRLMNILAEKYVWITGTINFSKVEKDKYQECCKEKYGKVKPKYTLFDTDKNFNITRIINNNKKKECYLISNEFYKWIDKTNTQREKVKKKRCKQYTEYDSDYIPIEDKDDVEQKTKILEQHEIYNLKRCGVDVFNRMISNYKNEHATNKWWKVLFYYNIDVCLINAYILYKIVKKDEKISHKEFRIKVAEGLAHKFEKKGRGRPYKK